jgi:hypothetical protein
MRVLGFLILFLSCNNIEHKKSTISEKQEKSKADSLNLQKITQSHRPTRGHKDTVLHLSIEDISTDGNEVTATYVNDTLRNAIWEIYGESGQRLIKYTLTRDGKIDVVDIRSSYKVPPPKVKSKKDVIWSKSLYQLDTSGALMTKKIDTNLLLVFPYFKQNVPLVLNP